LKLTEPETGMFRIISVKLMSVMNVKRNIQHAICALNLSFVIQYAKPLTSSVSAALANLGLEPSLDGVHRPPRATGLAGHEKDAVFLC
jgi:hypothetical protein